MLRIAYGGKHLTAACAGMLALTAAAAFPQESSHAPKAATPDAIVKPAAPNGAAGRVTVTVGKSIIIDSPLAIKRIATPNGALADTQAVSPKEILINGKVPGETSLIIWQQDDTRLIYDLTVVKSDKPEGK